jgi:hypothetical protein
LFTFLIRFPILNPILDSYIAFRLDFVCCLDLYAVVWSRLVFWARIWSECYNFGGIFDSILVNIFAFLIKFLILNPILHSYIAFRLAFVCFLHLYAVVWSRLVFWARIWSKRYNFVRNFDRILVNLFAFLIKFLILYPILDSYIALRLAFVCCLDFYAVVWSRLVFWARIWSEG